MVAKQVLNFKTVSNPMDDLANSKVTYKYSRNLDGIKHSALYIVSPYQRAILCCWSRSESDIAMRIGNY